MIPHDKLRARLQRLGVLSPTLFGLNIYEFDTYLDEIDMDSPCLFNTMLAIVLYADNVILHSKY